MSLLGREGQRALVLGAVIALTIGGLWMGLTLLPRTLIPEAPVTLELVIESPTWNTSYTATTANRTALTLLLEAADAQGFAVDWTYWESLQAAKVNAINGIRDGEGGLFWQYWVNGEYGDVGADQHALQEGDNVRWHHATYPPEGA